MSQLSATTAGSVSVLSSGNPLPTPATVTLPVPGVPTADRAAATAVINAYFEPFEGMLVTFPATLSVSEYFELARYGQVILTEGGRPRTFTDANPPNAAGLIAHEINLATRTLILDDTDNRQNRPVDAPNTPYYHPVPGLSATNFFRGGDTIANLTGVLHWSFAGQTGTDAWRVRPVTEAFNYAFTPANPRPALPAVGGRLKVASFNVLNYFLTVDMTASNDVGVCGPAGTLDCRGADSAAELARQRAKLLAALLGLEADVLGLIELENTTGVEPLADIVAGLPGYAYVNTGPIGTDAIKVGLIYRTVTVQPVGGPAILDSRVDPRFVDTRNRPALAQTFVETATGARFTAVVNHFKSKGSGCGAGDDDTTTGQGNCNLTRTQAAVALADWLATDPTGSGDPDVLIIGDLNSYAQEDPIVALEAAGYTNLVAAFGGPSAYSFVFNGQLGYLDHALANPSLTPQVTGMAEWHINADEVPLFDYNDEVRDAGEASFEEESDVLPLYAANEFRTSDHDPILVGLNLNAPPTVAAGGPYAVAEGGALTLSASGADPDNDPLSYAWDLDNDGTFETPGQSVTFSAAALDGPTTRTVSVRVSDGAHHTVTDSTGVTVNNVAPVVSAISAPAGPQLVNAAASVSATFSDAGVADTHTAVWDWGDGTTSSGVISGGTVTGSRAYPAPGAYLLRLTVTDDDGAATTVESAFVVVYDPAQKVTLKILYGNCNKLFVFGNLKQTLPLNPCAAATANLVAVTGVPQVGFFDIRLGAASSGEDGRNQARINAAHNESLTFTAGPDLGGRKLLGATLKVEGTTSTVVRVTVYDGLAPVGAYVFNLGALAPQGSGALANNYVLTFFGSRAFDRLVFTADSGAYSLVGGVDGSGPSEFFVSR
jgi:PKD repeat protein